MASIWREKVPRDSDDTESYVYSCRTTTTIPAQPALPSTSMNIIILSGALLLPPPATLRFVVIVHYFRTLFISFSLALAMPR